LNRDGDSDPRNNAELTCMNVIPLAVITLLANVGARLLVRKVSGTALPVGRGV